MPLLAASTILFSFSNVEQMSLFGVKEGYFFGDGGGGGLRGMQSLFNLTHHIQEHTRHISTSLITPDTTATIRRIGQRWANQLGDCR